MLIWYQATRSNKWSENTYIRASGTKIIGKNNEAGSVARMWIPCLPLYSGVEPKNRTGPVASLWEDLHIVLWGYLNCKDKKLTSPLWPEEELRLNNTPKGRTLAPVPMSQLSICGWRNTSVETIMVCQWAKFQAFCLHLYHMPGQHRAPSFQPHPALAPYELCSS